MDDVGTKEKKIINNIMEIINKKWEYNGNKRQQEKNNKSPDDKMV